jgi:hypothetical protein
MKKYIILVLIALLIGSLSVGVMAGGPSKPAGKSNIAHLYLYAKWDDGSEDWPITEGGAWGKMKYNLSGSTFDFVFNGHGLVPDEEYCLIYYEDPGLGGWSVLPSIFCLGKGTANSEGEVHIAGSAEPGNLPWPGDDETDVGAKIWLVPSSQVDCELGVWAGWVWTPDDYLFEGDMITFTQE